jgi:hypothetical protein
MTTAPPERRTSPRIAFRVPAHVTTLCDNVVYKGYVMNLSENGAFIQMMDCQQPLESLVRMRFHIKPSTNCDGSGQMARVMRMGTGQGFGVELTQVNESFVNFIRNLRSANEQDLIFFIRDLGRIDIWIGDDR